MLQAVVLQQDAITQVFRLFTDSTIKHAPNSFWNQIRETRHLVTGHPTGKRNDKTKDTKRVYLSRNSIHDHGFDLIVHDKNTGKDEFPHVDLLGLYEGYKNEAVVHLQVVTERQVKRWGELPDFWK